MHFEGSYRHIGTVDADPLVRVIESWGDAAWTDYVRRQQTFKFHSKTQTIPLIYDEDMRHTDPTPWPRFEELEPVLTPAMDLIRRANPSAGPEEAEGYFVRIILTRLLPDGAIPPHRDSGPSLVRSHRNHLAIVTNPEVEFAVDGEPRHFAAGEIWEINNRRYHSVRNPSSQGRIHAILDYVVPGERVQDPDRGEVIA